MPRSRVRSARKYEAEGPVPSDLTTQHAEDVPYVGTTVAANSYVVSPHWSGSTHLQIYSFYIPPLPVSYDVPIDPDLYAMEAGPVSGTIAYPPLSPTTAHNLGFLYEHSHIPSDTTYAAPADLPPLAVPRFSENIPLPAISSPYTSSYTPVYWSSQGFANDPYGDSLDNFAGPSQLPSLPYDEHAPVFDFNATQFETYKYV